MYVRGYLQGSENGRVVKLKAKEVEPKMLFGKISLWIRSRATIWVVFGADYEIKLLVITSGKGEITRTLQNVKQVWFGFSTS